ncbi:MULTISPECIES: nucleotidyltransferase family protein [unclassified Coleofasciculus]|uniref:nucleotidyltransferase family protein n=1 Tax=unclassified Coleofasciculus TaxID=2692782 RepID=UPI0018830239|nr:MULTISPECIES: nucleotidyltransferase family protein [unclassified Coleofasciculus]MBE9130248.1 nucleotidyltransferase family protein [Coleofasciculus sp. LEGE 07081]MBE9152059.1 nucleotidyltransferase family protein [Coleofasciculus sp. LEGE 07092]
MRNLEDIKQLLQKHQDFLRTRFRVSEMQVFGSYARGQQTADSDVDILICYESPPTLWMLGELRDYLSEILGLRVDIVTEKGLKPRIRERVLAEAVKV